MTRKSPHPWENFAREDAAFFIRTENADQSEDGSFVQSGEHDADLLYVHASPYITNLGSALEIGAGIGRLVLPQAKRFAHVTATDISPTMLAKLRQRAVQAESKNITTLQTTAAWDAPQAEGFPYDYIYTYACFQHIEDASIIEAYLQRVAGALKPEGIFQAHLDTRPQPLSYRLRNKLPDWLLTQTHRKNIRRVRRSADWFRTTASRHGLELVHQYLEDTADHIFIFKSRVPYCG